MAEYKFTAIGTIHSCFKGKFGIPRQPGLVTEARARLELIPPYNREEALRELETFSHVWIQFVFHETMREEWKTTVRPPRLGGNKRIGVFATRSNFRPNPIGLSVVKLAGIVKEKGKLYLDLRGGDFLDGTPVLDIKPYIPYADTIVDAEGGYTTDIEFRQNEVAFTPLVEKKIENLNRKYPFLKELIKQILQNDQRPGYYNEKSDKRKFGFHLYEYDVKWECDSGKVTVLDMEPFREDG